MTHQPKGGMCATCTNRDRDCSALPFDRYPVIGRYSYNGKPVAIVKCAEFLRAGRDGQSLIVNPVWGGLDPMKGLRPSKYRQPPPLLIGITLYAGRHNHVSHP
ncbi:hypothetical protein SAMN05216198_1515 [Halopseudomonas litoralis]|uniref:Uncharacterized protein n=1 Tax=Halopseudomonas litoralis TaxID=797277 RepID=A0A1H1QL07_9GAMM|nr:hypothetical protein SAMN05216198_1515 [Halopseudomonas litoralis]